MVERVIPAELRAFVRKSTTLGFIQAALFQKEFTDHFNKLTTLLDVKPLSIQALMCKLFDPAVDGTFLAHLVILLKYRMLVQFQKLPKESIKYLQWPMNTYGKWFHAHPGHFRLTRQEIQSLQQELTRAGDDDEFDIAEIEDLLG